jgi:hypothetical protein
LLQLRRENLLQSKTLCLLHSLRGHTPSLPVRAAMSKLCRGRRAACGHRIAAGTAAATTLGARTHALQLSVHHDPIELSFEPHDFSE